MGEPVRAMCVPSSSLLAAARSVLEVEALSMEGVPGRLPVLELPPDPLPPPRFGGVRFFCAGERVGGA